MRQRVCGREGGQRQGRADGLLQPPGVAEGANQPVMRFNICGAWRRGAGSRGARLCGFDCNGGAKSLGSLSRRPGCEQVKPALAVLFGCGNVGCGHGYL